MAKQIKTSQEARDKIKKGMDNITNIVKTTLGPKGRSVIIEKEWGDPDILQDGVTIARSIDYKDRFENTGATLVKSASIKTNDEAGDGTTTAMVLAQAMITAGMEYAKIGVSSLNLRKGMKKAIKDIIAEVKSNSKKINDKTEMEQIATISAKDKEIGKLVADAMMKVGKTGIVNVEKGQTNKIEQETVEGFRFKKGFVSPYMINNKEKEVAEYDNPYILITDKALNDMDSILPIFEELATAGRKELVIIGGDIGGNVLPTLVVNTVRNTFKSVAIKAPDFGDRMKESLKDIALLTGGTVITQDLGIELKDVKLEHLGKAKKIVVSKDYTTIIEGKGDKEKIELQIKELEKKIKNGKDEFNKEKYRERLGRLSGVVALIKVGANSEVEQNELETRIEDALSATQSALEEGVVVGGGIALVRARENLKGKDKEAFTSSDEEKGYNIIMDAIEQPFNQILINAGHKTGEVVMSKLLERSENEGYDAEAKTYVDMFKAGIIDPTKVVRCALENAGSIAEMFLSTEAVVCLEDIKEPTINQ